MRKHYTEYSRDFEEKVIDYLIEKLKEFNYDGFTCDSYDLHNEVFNTDYVVIGCYQAKQMIAENIDDLFYMLDEYEQEFGESYKDIQDVERVLNLMYYMCGLQLFNELNLHSNEYNGILEQKDIQKIIDYLEEEQTK